MKFTGEGESRGGRRGTVKKPDAPQDWWTGRVELDREMLMSKPQRDNWS